MTVSKTTFPTIVLVSASPRRRAILEKLGLPLVVAPAHVDEDAIPYSSPRELALKAAYAKIQARAHEWQNTILLACDTIVALDGHVFGKPRDYDDARQMLRRLSGRRHSVISGVAVKATPSSVLLDAEETFVTFRPLTEEQIDAYVKSGEPMDKAGAYAIQGLAGKFVANIEGDYWNVVGLPVEKLLEMLGQFIDVGHLRQAARNLRKDDI
ncbi:MAG: Maf family protein [Candidatus Sumerlaeaceae bacterium]|nr:Maf family protein [Candidatus Sumerlaeaceae bacterium]